jgi:hypothetical protein
VFAAIDPNEEMGSVGFFIFAGILILIALGTLISGVHPRWRAIATWRGLTARSVFGSVAFSAGAFIMAIGMVVRGVIEQRGPLAGIVLWLFAGGAVVLVLGPLGDLFQSVRRR